MALLPGREGDNGITQQDVAVAVSAQGSRCSGLEKVVRERGDLGLTDSMNSYVKMYMHEGYVSGIILENFSWLSLACEELFPKSAWKKQICTDSLIHLY